MPPFDASAAPMLPDLGRVVLSWLEHADLCEVLRKRAQVVGLRARLALPRRATPETTSRWLSGVHVLCELVSRERFGARVCFLALPADQAAGLFDRVLGGSGQMGVAGAAGALSDAECGVLAHLAAQACAACGGALAVRDVFCADAEKLRAVCADGVLWPLQIAASALREAPGTDAPRVDARAGAHGPTVDARAGAHGPTVDARAGAHGPTVDARAGARGPTKDAGDLVFDAKLLFAAAEDCPAGCYPLALALQDAIAPETLAALEVGDLLTSDAWPLMCTARGLEGTVALVVGGIEERAAAVLSGARVLCTRDPARRAATSALDADRKPGQAAPAELRLYELALGFWQLAELASGGSLELPDSGPGEATLYVASQPCAAGCWVRLRGAIALRVQALFSATRSDSAASSACPPASGPG